MCALVLKHCCFHYSPRTCFPNLSSAGRLMRKRRFYWKSIFTFLNHRQFRVFEARAVMDVIMDVMMHSSTLIHMTEEEERIVGSSRPRNQAQYTTNYSSQWNITMKNTRHVRFCIWRACACHQRTHQCNTLFSMISCKFVSIHKSFFLFFHPVRNSTLLPWVKRRKWPHFLW